MSYHIYRTEGFILGSKNTGEANRQFLVYTKEIGFIYANAQGVRLLKSKLRHLLQDFSLCNLSLVRGKDHWRITNVAENSNPLKGESLVVFAKICLILKRFLHGEELNERLWSTLISGFNLLSTDELENSQLKSIEIILVLQSLSALGYISLPNALERLVNEPVSASLISFLIGNERAVLSEINRALRESQL